MVASVTDHRVSVRTGERGVYAVCSCGAMHGPASPATVRAWVDRHAGSQEGNPYWAGM